MKLVKGSKLFEIDTNELDKLTTAYSRVVVDLGTGDGRFVFKHAEKDNKTFYIGIDPAYKQMVEFSKKANKKHLENVIFVVGSVEDLPNELCNIADALFIILPWGTLLRHVANPTEQDINILKSLMKKDAYLTIIFGYTEEVEPNEVSRLELDSITAETLKDKLIPFYESHNFKLLENKIMSQKELKEFESTWGKRIQQRIQRSIFRITLHKYDLVLT